MPGATRPWGGWGCEKGEASLVGEGFLCPFQGRFGSLSVFCVSCHCAPSPLMVVAIVVGLLMLWRLGFGPLVMLAALLGLLPHH